MVSHLLLELLQGAAQAGRACRLADAEHARRRPPVELEQDAERDHLALAGGKLGEGLSPSLEAALAELSAGEREVVALRVLLEFDGRTAARVLGISQTACSTRLSRALQKLEEKVRNDGS